MLKRECADRYPSLPARMWTSAARLAELVGFDRQAPQRPGAVKKERPLSEADFEFRGGSPRWAAELTVHTRTGELYLACSSPRGTSSGCELP